MQVARKFLVAVVAGIVAVNSVACSINGVPVAAKAPEAPLSVLMPLTANDRGVAGKDGISCEEGTEAVPLLAYLGTDEVVPHTDRVWVHKKNPVSKNWANSEAIYTFTKALPQVRSVIVTFGAKLVILPGTGWVANSDVSYKTTWPTQAATEPVRVSMSSLNFSKQVQTLKAATFCMEL